MKNTLAKVMVLTVLCYCSRSMIASPMDSLYRIVYETNDLEYIRDLVPIYEQTATDEALGKLYFLVAWKYEKVQNMGKSFDYYNQSLKFYEKTGNLEKQERCLDNLGGLALRLSQNEKAKAYYSQAWVINSELGDKVEIALSLRDISITLSKNPKTRKEAVWYLTQAADLLEQVKEYELLGEIYLKMGILHKELGAYGSALDSYELALKFAPDSDEILARVLNGQSNVLFIKGDYQQALIKQNAAIRIKTRLGDDLLLASSLNNLGVIQYKMGDFEAAYISLLESFNLNIAQKELKQRSYQNLHESYSYLDSVCLALGDDSRLWESGVHREFLAKESKMIENLEVYHIKDLAFQGQLIEEKEALAEQKAFLSEMLVYGTILICIVLVVLVYFMIQKRKLVLAELRRREDVKARLRKYNIFVD